MGTSIEAVTLSFVGTGIGIGGVLLVTLVTLLQPAVPLGAIAIAVRVLHV